MFHRKDKSSWVNEWYLLRFETTIVGTEPIPFSRCTMEGRIPTVFTWRQPQYPSAPRFGPATCQQFCDPTMQWAMGNVFPTNCHLFMWGHHKLYLIQCVSWRRMCGQESDGDGGGGEKKERKTEAEVVGQHQERLAGERIVMRGSARPG